MLAPSNSTFTRILWGFNGFMAVIHFVREPHWDSAGLAFVALSIAANLLVWR